MSNYRSVTNTDTGRQFKDPEYEPNQNNQPLDLASNHPRNAIKESVVIIAAFPPPI